MKGRIQSVSVPDGNGGMTTKWTCDGKSFDTYAAALDSTQASAPKKMKAKKKAPKKK